MKNKPSAILVICALGMLGCQELYNDPSIDAVKELIVIKGLITDAEGPYSVNLSRTISFNAHEPSVYTDELGIEGAEITISDDSGNSEQLSEAGKGHYVTSAGGIKGIIGNTYTLSIKTPDGNSYQSEPCLLRPAPEITALYLVNAEELAPIIGYNGVMHFEMKKGVRLCADISGLENNTYYRFDIRSISESREWIGYGFFPPYIQYCWTTTHFRTQQNLLVTDHLSGDNLAEHQVIFLAPQAYPAKYLLPYANSFSLDGRIIGLDIYSVSAETYNYYSSFYGQLSAENRIFDPIPTNLSSNIYCRNNTSQLVLGLFEASGKYTRNCLVNYVVGDLAAKYKDVGYVPPDITAGCQYDFKPDFWKLINE
jgi:hypothetical protein